MALVGNLIFFAIQKIKTNIVDDRQVTETKGI